MNIWKWLVWMWLLWTVELLAFQDQDIHLNPAPNTLMFEKIGPTTGKLSMVHLIIPVDLGQVHDVIDKFCDSARNASKHIQTLKTLSKLASATGEPGLLALEARKVAIAVEGQCDILEHRFLMLEQVWLNPVDKVQAESMKATIDRHQLTKMSQNPPTPVEWDYDTPISNRSSRNKRQFVIGAIGVLSAVAAFSSIYSQVHLESLAAQAQKREQYNLQLVKHTAMQVNINRKAIIILQNATEEIVRLMDVRKSVVDSFGMASDLYMGALTLNQDTTRIINGL